MYAQNGRSVKNLILMTNNLLLPSGNRSEKAAPSPHLNFLDGLRALAAIYVMLHHTWLTVYWNDRRPDHLTSILGGWLNYGHFAVDFFIVLSGFCLMIPVARGDGSLLGGPTCFFKKRARRILPPYYAALALSLAFATTILSHKIETVWDYSLPLTRMGVVAHLLLLQNIHRGMEINSVFWSIAVECQIYLLFPMIVVAWRILGWQKTAAATIVLSLVASFLLQHTRLQGLTAHYLALFTLGMVGSVITFSDTPVMSRYRRSIPWKIISLALFALLILSTQLPGVFTKYLTYVDLLVGLFTTALIVAMAGDHRNWLYRILNWNPLVFVGTFSYSLYLLHMPLLQILWQYVLAPLHVPNLAKLFLLCLIGGPSVIFVCYLFFVAFERPFISRRRNAIPAETATIIALSPAP